VASELNLTCSLQVNLDDATPMLRQFLEVKRAHPGVILFYRMGDFYETFFEDAVITAKAIDITLTGREGGKLGRIPMAGVPARAVDTYLQRLLEKKFKVAICEQMEDPSLAKGLVERRVTRILSSGTLNESQYLEAKSSSYLACCTLNPKTKIWGLAYADVSTGEFFTTELSAEELRHDLSRIQPSELLVPGKKVKGVVIDEWHPDVEADLAASYLLTALPTSCFNLAHTEGKILDWFPSNRLENLGLADRPEAAVACGALLSYLEQTYIEAQRPQFDKITLYHIADTMRLTASTRKHLELTQTVKDGKKEGSLLGLLDKTFTAMGGRRLKQFLQAPSINQNEINHRLDAVEFLVTAQDTLASLATILQTLSDIERLGAKLQTLTIAPRDLVALKRSCAQLPVIAGLFTPGDPLLLAELTALPASLFEFITLIENSLLEVPATTLKEGGIFKPGYSEELDRFNHLVSDQDSWLAAYEQQEKERTQLKTLKVSSNSAFGFYIEISKGQAAQAPPEYYRKQTLTHAERYITPELKQHEEAVMDAKTKLFSLESTLYIDLRLNAAAYAMTLKQWADKIATLDVLRAFAQLAFEQHYCRPILDDSLNILLEDARHAVLEDLMPFGSFVSNDCSLSAETDPAFGPQIQMITGPNMAGKSTYMRQLALIVVLAQIGCFVPARSARIGLVDQIFTRIGAVDDLSSGQSTFMVEMNETAQILNCATPRSLVLLDEIGRGTSTYDGVAIAWSVTEHLVKHTGCRTLFATHYHELNTMSQLWPRIENYRVLVSETEGKIEFLHRVVPGAAQKSYGIQVAKMAGLPKSVIQQAEKLMSRMQEKELTVIDKQRQHALLEAAQDDQLKLFQSE
jgi:DNA mismatch repair protein MutS